MGHLRVSEPTRADRGDRIGDRVEVGEDRSGPPRSRLVATPERVVVGLIRGEQHDRPVEGQIVDDDAGVVSDQHVRGREHNVGGDVVVDEGCTEPGQAARPVVHRLVDLHQDRPASTQPLRQPPNLLDQRFRVVLRIVERGAAPGRREQDDPTRSEVHPRGGEGLDRPLLPDTLAVDPRVALLDDKAGVDAAQPECRGIHLLGHVVTAADDIVGLKEVPHDVAGAVAVALLGPMSYPIRLIGVPCHVLT